jgi:phospholipid/cholesterol/gamma-HCH transport system substrate-binding protein
VFSDFLVSGARVVTAVADRRDDLSGLVSNSNEALGAIASENVSFDRALKALPPALRQANTTFFNLRLTLDDLDPLINTAKTTTKDLAPFLRKLKPVVKKSVPVFHDLRLAVNRGGKNNDLADAFAKLPSVRNAANSAIPPTVQSLSDSLQQISFFRAYAPDLTGAISGLNQITAYYDDAGHYARVEPAGLNIFNYVPPNLTPIPGNVQYNAYGAPVFGGPNLKYFRRCPGGATQRSTDLSNPFVGAVGGIWPGSGLTDPAPPGDCTAADRPAGP